VISSLLHCDCSGSYRIITLVAVAVVHSSYADYAR
jgi:hypothetical protein